MQRCGLLGSSRWDLGEVHREIMSGNPERCLAREALLCMPLFSWELCEAPVNFSAEVSTSWGDFVTRLCSPACCAVFVVVQGLFGLCQALCPPEGIIAVAEEDIQVISMPQGSSQVRLTCILSAPLTHCRLQKRSGGLAPLSVGLCLWCGGFGSCEVGGIQALTSAKRLHWWCRMEQQMGCRPPAGLSWGRFPEDAVHRCALAVRVVITLSVVCSRYWFQSLEEKKVFFFFFCHRRNLFLFIILHISGSSLNVHKE